MSKYQLRFWFEHGGFCLWGMNDKAKEMYGYAIKNEDLPISEDLINVLNDLEYEYGTYLDWDYPTNPSPWTKERKLGFLDKTTDVYMDLKDELGSEFEIINEVDKSVVL